ncbi:ABC transporter permease subunit [Mycoplasmopsis sturni]|uniref:ABC transporter permease subunit n=1 Tax=Mycoplasmopsis sturni TaxID=39047 RepID=UPI00056739CF|nr:ABC transporter permease subunit [Mycoplasmopsis sturni]
MRKIKAILYKMLFYQVQIDNKKTPRKIRPIWIHFLLVSVIVCLVLVFSRINFSISSFGFHIFWRNLKQLFTISNTSEITGNTQNLTLLTFNYLWISIKFALSGTFIGSILALLCTLFTNKIFVHRYFAFVFKLLFLIIRGFPEFVFILLFQSIFSQELTLLLVYIWFSWLWLLKYFDDLLDNLNLNKYWLSIKLGNGKLSAFLKEIYPQINNKIINLFLYSFESNIRWSSYLSVVGVIGVGTLIKHPFEAGLKDFKSEFFIPFAILISFILFLEIINYLTKTFLLADVNQKLKINFIKWQIKYNYRGILKKLIFLVLCIFSIVVIIQTNKNLFYNGFFGKWIWQLFSVDFSVLNFSFKIIQDNIFYQVFQSYLVALAIFVWLIIVSLILLFFSTSTLSSKKTKIVFVSIEMLFRSVPTVVFIFVFLPLFESPIALLVIFIGISLSGSFVKQLIEHVEKIPQKKIENLYLQGWSKLRIYFKFVLPSIKYDLYYLVILYFELSFRNTIAYSFLSNNELLLGSELFNALGEQQHENLNFAFSYAWVIVFNICLIHLTSRIISYNLKRKCLI